MPASAPSLRPVTPVGILADRLEQALGLAEELLADRAGQGEHAARPRDRRRRDDLEELVGELRDAHDLAAGLEPYTALCTTPESPALAALALRTEAHAWGDGGLEAEMLSGHVEGQLLKFLVAMTGAERVLEIGVFTGYSALAIAEALGEHGHVVACELDPGVAAFAQQSFDASPHGERIEVRIGPAAETLSALASAGAAFDLVFVDADKAGYHGYVQRLLDDGLLADGGTICVDNTLMQGEPWRSGEPSANGAAITAFNAWLADEPRVEQVLVPLRDGVTLIRRAR